MQVEALTCKDAKWTAEQHISMLRQLPTDLQLRVGGFVMDNTKTNRASFKILQQEVPGCLTLGCAAHALALAFKDLSKGKGWVEGVQRVYDTAQMMAGVVGDNKAMRGLLQRTQKKLRQPEKLVSRHCPTRFATMHIISGDLLECIDALKLMVIESTFPRASKNCTHAKEFKAAALGGLDCAE